jgi:hypothetical protein
MDAHRYAELRRLVQCLEADAAIRLASTDSDHRYAARARLSDLERTEKPQEPLSSDLLRLSAKTNFDASVRAAAFDTLGLLERHKRQHGEFTTTLEGPDEDRELRYFYQAHDLLRSADTCFYLAESLLERDRKAEASLYLTAPLATALSVFDEVHAALHFMLPNRFAFSVDFHDLAVVEGADDHIAAAGFAGAGALHGHVEFLDLLPVLVEF